MTQFDFEAHLQRQREWSGRTFGPGPRTAGVVDHIRKELAEITAAPGDISEWIDVVILALDGAWRAGASPQDIIAELVAKQAKNEARVWPDWRTMSPDKAIEHDRSRDFKVGDRVEFARRLGANTDHEDAPPMGWQGVIDTDDKSPVLPFRVMGEQWAGHHYAWWFHPDALDIVEDSP